MLLLDVAIFFDACCLGFTSLAEMNPCMLFFYVFEGVNDYFKFSKKVSMDLFFYL